MLQHPALQAKVRKSEVSGWGEDWNFPISWFPHVQKGGKSEISDCPGFQLSGFPAVWVFRFWTFWVSYFSGFWLWVSDFLGFQLSEFLVFSRRSTTDIVSMCVSVTGVTQARNYHHLPPSCKHYSCSCYGTAHVWPGKKHKYNFNSGYQGGNISLCILIGWGNFAFNGYWKGFQSWVYREVLIVSMN